MLDAHKRININTTTLDAKSQNMDEWDEFLKNKQAHIDGVRGKSVCRQCGQHSDDLKMCEYGDGTAEYPHCNNVLCCTCRYDLMSQCRCKKHAYCVYCRLKADNHYYFETECCRVSPVCANCAFVYNSNDEDCTICDDCENNSIFEDSDPWYMMKDGTYHTLHLKWKDFGEYRFNGLTTHDFNPNASESPFYKENVVVDTQTRASTKIYTKK